LRHRIDGGLAIADAATAAYRHEPIGNAVWRAQAFIDLMKNHSQTRTPTGETPPTVQEPPPLLIDVEQAAKLLGIGPRKLHELTQAGIIPHVPIGDRVLYHPPGLATWAEANQKREPRNRKRNRKPQKGAISSDFERFFG
jgi:hypothetical protein